MKDGWREAKLGELCKIKTGKLNANAAVDGGQYPFFTCSKQNYTIDSYSFDGEALLIAGNGDVGNVKYYNGKFDAYQRTYVLMDFDIDAMFLFYYLKDSMPKRARDMLNGTAVPYIKLSCITDMEIRFPESLEEQKRIARVLSEVDKLSNTHQSKVNVLTRMKDQLMSNKQGIIEREKQRSVLDTQIYNIESKISKNLGIKFNISYTDINSHKVTLSRIAHVKEVLTYIGEDEQNERERV